MVNIENETHGPIIKNIVYSSSSAILKIASWACLLLINLMIRQHLIFHSNGTLDYEKQQTNCQTAQIKHQFSKNIST